MSRPWRASSPSAQPSHSPALPCSPRHSSAAPIAESRIAPTSMPAAAAGTSPNGLQRAVAAADVRVAVEDLAEAVLARQLLERRARVGDRGEVRAVALARVEGLEHRHRLDRPARLRGDDHQRAVEVDAVEDLADLVRVRRVQDVQRQAVVELAEGLAEDLRGEARAAHAEHDRVAVALGAQALGELCVGSSSLLALAVGDVQPAEPVGDLRGALRRPQRAVLAPDTTDDVLVGGPLQTGGDRIGVALGDVGFDRRDVAHARFLLQGLQIASHASERAAFRKCRPSNPRPTAQGGQTPMRVLSRGFSARSRSSTARARAATFSPVKPKCL